MYENLSTHIAEEKAKEREEGREEGREKALKETAREMHLKGFDIQIISEVTKLPIDTVRDLCPPKN